MKQSFVYLSFMLLSCLSVQAQTPTKDLKVGHIFHISIPDYMDRTIGLNNAASVQFKNDVKDIGGFIIEDNKEELQLAQTHFATIREYYDYFIKDFLKDEEKRAVADPKTTVAGATSFIETDASCYDKDSKIDIYYYVCLVETASSYYKILCYTSLENKDKYKADFQKIAFNLRD